MIESYNPSIIMTASAPQLRNPSVQADAKLFAARRDPTPCKLTSLLDSHLQSEHANKANDTSKTTANDGSGDRSSACR